MELLVAQDIHKVYRGPREELHILRGLSLTVSRGEFVGITGPSGSGKTTLLNILGALDFPTSGTVKLGQQYYKDMKDDRLSYFRNREIGFVFQFHHLLPDFTALENVMLPGLVGRARLREVRERAMSLLDIVGLADRAHHIPRELSGGESQRVAVARALINEPSVLLADEPTGNLDSANTENLMELLWSLNRVQGITIVMVTHDEGLAKYFTTLYRLREGVLVPG